MRASRICAPIPPQNWAEIERFDIAEPEQRSLRMTSAMLTEPRVRALAAKPPSKRDDVPDGSIRGLFLRVGPRAKPTWTLRYSITGDGGVTARGKTLQGRKFYRVSLGDYPSVSVKAARAKASKFLEDAERGANPIAVLEESASAARDTVAGLASDFLAQHVRTVLRSGKNAEWVFRAFIIPRLGDKAITRVKRADVVALLGDLLANSGPTAAIETRKWLSSMFSWGIEKGRLDANPIAHIRPPAKHFARERALSLDEARAVWRAAAAEPYPSGPLVQLLMLTGARLREIACAERSWLDRDSACLAVPGHSYKTGDPTIIALVPDAMRILESMPGMPSGPFLLSTTAGAKPVYTVTPSALGRLKLSVASEFNGCMAHWTIHDLRRTVATHLGRLGVDELMIERVLGHRIGGVRAVYNRYRYLEEKRKALSVWARELLG